MSTTTDPKLVPLNGSKSTKRERMRKHMKKHWKYYASISGALVVGSVLGARSGIKTVTLIKNAKDHLPVYVTEAARGRMGRPSNIVMDLGTKEMWSSQGTAARARGVSQSTMSKHLAGKTDAIHGHVYDVVGKMYI